MKTPKPAPFCLISSHHGTMIINRNDYRMIDDTRGYGVGFQIMNRSCYDPSELQTILELLTLRHHYTGDGVVMIDCGANIGVHSIECGSLMEGWGKVYAFEAQEYIYYALCGNIVINNCLNVSARHAAVGGYIGEIDIPEPNYFAPASFGSFELKKTSSTEFIGQSIDYNSPTKTISQITLDALSLPRVDFIKIDVEGMEEEVLAGAIKLISAFKPIMFIEIIKSDNNKLNEFLANFDFVIFPMGGNVLAIHKNDPVIKHLNRSETNQQG